MNLLELPQEVLVKILSHMDASNVAVCSQVSTAFADCIFFKFAGRTLGVPLLQDSARFSHFAI